MTKQLVTEWSYEVIGCAIEVHRQLGPGLIESVYEACLYRELILAGLKADKQGRVPIHYKGLDLDVDLRFDLLVNDCIIIENKAVEVMLPVFKAQLLTYLKLTRKPKGLMFNFNSANLQSQMISMVSEYFSLLPDE